MLLDRVTSPMLNSSVAINATTYLSPSMGASNGSAWSAALDEQLNKPISGNEPSSQSTNSKEIGKENISGSQASRGEFGRISKAPAKVVIDREILSPEMV